jgi:PAS domain S-box-containing protein
MVDLGDGQERVLRGTAEPLLVMDENGDVLDASKGACELFGFSREELASMSLFDLYRNPTIRRERQETLRPILAEGRGSFEAEVRSKAGEPLFVRFDVEAVELDGDTVLLARVFDATEEREKRDQLTARLQLLESSLRGSQEALLLIDKEGNVSLATPEAARLLGREAPEVEGCPLQELREAACMPEEVEDVVRRGLEGEYVEGYELELGEGAESRLLVASVEPVALEGGETEACMLRLRDVTRERQVMRGLEESRDLYHSLVEKSPEGIYLVDRDGSIIFANQRLCEMLGQEPGALNTRSLLDFIGEEQMEPLKGYFRSKVAGLYAPPLRIDLQSQNGPIPVEMDCSLLESGEEITGILGVVRDLSWRLDLEEENRVYQASLAAIFSLAQALSKKAGFQRWLEEALFVMVEGLGGDAGAVFLMDEEKDQLELAAVFGMEPGAIEFLQEKGSVLREGSVGIILRRREPLRSSDRETEGELQEELLAVGRGGIIGMPFGSDERLNGLALVYGEEDSLLPGGKELYSALGDLFQVGVARARLLDSVTGVMEKEAAIDLELRAAERIKEQFVELVDEKLREPVQRLRVFIENLQKGWSRFSPAAIDDYFRELSWEMADLERMIDRLLLLSAEESNRLRLEITPFEITSLLEKVAQIFVSRSGEHEIELELPPYMLIVEADQSLLEHVLMNLMDNAIRFSPGGGSVRLALTEKEKEVVISVRDEGLGFSEEEKTHLFEKFAKPLQREKQESAGLGLGLYLSRAVVEAHGGRIELVSRQGEGSTVFVILPKRRR